MPLLQRSLRTEAVGCEIQIIITARQFHYLGEGYVALAHIRCLPRVQAEKRRGGMGRGCKASLLWPWRRGRNITPCYHGGLSSSYSIPSSSHTAHTPQWDCAIGLWRVIIFKSLIKHSDNVSTLWSSLGMPLIEHCVLDLDFWLTGRIFLVTLWFLLWWMWL